VEDEFEIGMSLLQDLADRVRAFRREPVPISKLKVGLKCGGSDGFSGITANPLLGAFSDRLIAAGGTTLLTEVPEMFGAETILMNRCASRDVFDKCVRLINDFKTYFQRYGQPIYENPSYGNKEGGLTTLEEKSLGCTQKGGTSPVVDVVGYGEPVTCSGLNLVQAPGYDGVSITALTAAGAHLILFTTGRGTPMGAPVPTVKISSTSQLAQRKKSWIDLDAGALLEGKPMDDLADELLHYVVDVASGRSQSCNEQNDFREIVIFKDGVTV
jgi:altronate hydrolase